MIRKFLIETGILGGLHYGQVLMEYDVERRFGEPVYTREWFAFILGKQLSYIFVGIVSRSG